MTQYGLDFFGGLVGQMERKGVCFADVPKKGRPEGANLFDCIALGDAGIAMYGIELIKLLSGSQPGLDIGFVYEGGQYGAVSRAETLNVIVGRSIGKSNVLKLNLIPGYPNSVSLRDGNVDKVARFVGSHTHGMAGEARRDSGVVVVADDGSNAEASDVYNEVVGRVPMVVFSNGLSYLVNSGLTGRSIQTGGKVVFCAEQR